MSELLYGKAIAQTIHERLTKDLKKMKSPLGLAAILVGDDPASRLYVGLKEKAAKEVGFYFERFEFEKEVKENELIKRIQELNDRDDIHGILVQLPLPQKNEERIIKAIDPKKDVDGFHPHNRAHWEDEEPTLYPPVALSIMELITSSHQPLEQKRAIIISNSDILATPIRILLEQQGIVVERLSKDTSAMASKTRAADILIVAVGQADFLTQDMVKEGAIVIDVGTNKKNGKNVGDVSPDVFKVAGFISPVPGGVGPLTVAFLLKNVLTAAQRVQE